MTEILLKYIPDSAVNMVEDLLLKHPVHLKIVHQRLTKHGDFKKTNNGSFQITVNNSLNTYHFLLTLIHEIAHLVTYKQHKFVKPHGIEWKENFQHLMLPFLDPAIYPSEILPYLANYLKNPKASTGSDVKLMHALNQFDAMSGKNFIFELEHGSIFTFKNKAYQKGKLRRTRFECVELDSKRKYLFNQNAEIEAIKDS